LQSIRLSAAAWATFGQAQCQTDSVVVELFLDSELLLFERLEHGIIGHGSAHFLLDPAFETGVLEL